MASKESSQPFPVKESDILVSDTTSYRIVDFLGEGCFGKVAECLDLIEGNTVAVKIHKNCTSREIQREVKMLEAIRNIDPDKNNIIKFMEHFSFNNLSCLAFEMLDKSLWDLMMERDWKRLHLSEIRPVTSQLLVAFKALRENGIMHTDLKLDNIMLVNHQNQPFKIKLIDFGMAIRANQVKVGIEMQNPAYRAPEVALGMPLSESVDMWGVGCVMANLYLGGSIFPVGCYYFSMKMMLKLLGKPDDRLLDIGKYTMAYFTKDGNSKWRFRTPEEYTEVTGMEPNICEWFTDIKNCTLEDIISIYPGVSTSIELIDREAFVDLVISCLHPNYDDRITPKDALKHDFVTMAHLNYSYVHCALKRMAFMQHSYEDDQNCKEPTTSNDSSSEINHRLDNNDPNPDKSCGPAKQDREEVNYLEVGRIDRPSSGQPYTSNRASCPSSPGNNDPNPNKSCGPAGQDQEEVSYLKVGRNDSLDNNDPNTGKSCGPAKQDQEEVNHLEVGRIDRPSSDIVPNGCTTASISSNHGAAASTYSTHGNTTSLPAPVGSEEPDNIETVPVPARRKTIRQRIGRFFRRVRKLFCC